MFKYNFDNESQLSSVVLDYIDSDPELMTVENLENALKEPEFQAGCCQAYLEDKQDDLQHVIYSSDYDAGLPDADEPDDVPPYWAEEFSFFGVTNKDYFQEADRLDKERGGYALPVFKYLEDLLRLDDNWDPKTVAKFFNQFRIVTLDDFYETYNLEQFEQLNDFEPNIPDDGYVAVTRNDDFTGDGDYYAFFTKRDAELYLDESYTGGKVLTAKDFWEEYCYPPEKIKVDKEEDPSLEYYAIATDGTKLKDYEWNDTMGAYVHLHC